MSTAMLKQTYRLKDFGPREMLSIETLGLDWPEGIEISSGRNWLREHVCRDRSFMLAVLEGFFADADNIAFTKQEDYIKINFWLQGRHTSVLDGFGQHEHDRPEVFVTSGPHEMTKVDVLHTNSHIAAVAVGLKREFFPLHMGIAPEELPEPLRSMLSRGDLPYTFCQFPLSPELLIAARALLVAPHALRRSPTYGRAKCIELMCLMIELMTSHGQKTLAPSPNRQEARLRRARDILIQHYAEPTTLEDLARDVGLNRVALSAGFRKLFGASVYDFLQQQRMQRAYELLQNDNTSVNQVAAAVGFSHACNFSTAFHAFFGCTPQQSRRRRDPQG